MEGTKGVNQAYLAAEAKARVEIDQQLAACGWLVQNRADLNLYAGQGVAIREFTMAEGHGRADYLLFVDRQAVGTIEAKPKGTTLTEVEIQSSKYATGVPGQVKSGFDRLPFAYESTGVETRFTNGLDPDPRSRPVFTFHRPTTVAGWIEEHDTDPERPTLPLVVERQMQPKREQVGPRNAPCRNASRPRLAVRLTSFGSEGESRMRECPRPSFASSSM
jgi:type I restriction enzyme R subunit